MLKQFVCIISRSTVQLPDYESIHAKSFVRSRCYVDQHYDVRPRYLNRKTDKVQGVPESRPGSLLCTRRTIRESSSQCRSRDLAHDYGINDFLLARSSAFRYRGEENSATIDANNCVNATVFRTASTLLSKLKSHLSRRHFRISGKTTAHIINLLIRLHKTITLKPAIFSSHGQPSTLVFNVKGRIHFSIVARVRSRYKEILFNWTGCLHGFSTTASSPGSAHARVKPNRLAETNRGTLDKLFIEKQGVGGQKRSDTVYKKVLKRKKNEKKNREAARCWNIQRHDRYHDNSIVTAINHQWTLTIHRMQSASILLRVATKKHMAHYVCVRIRPWPSSTFSLLALQGPVCPRFIPAE